MCFLSASDATVGVCLWAEQLVEYCVVLGICSFLRV